MREPPTVRYDIRSYRESDAPEIVGLSLRAWAPVFDTERATVGDVIFERLYGDDWRPHQRKDVEDALDGENARVWVADLDGQAVGFVVVKLDVDRGMGEIWMLAVDPAFQRRGIGTALTNAATDRIRELGLALAMIDTGGDVGHSPARRTYERAGYTPMPIVRYFKAL